MSNQLVMFDAAAGGTLSQKFNPIVAAGAANDLGEGIRGSYGIVSIKAGRFRIKYKGQEQIVMDYTDRQNPRPVATIDVVIIKANPFLNKQFYAGKYVEGSNSPPDCYSLDGKVPSPAVAQPQHTNCALCPKNQFGSVIGDNGTKQKACRDTKKLAIVPLASLRNEALGGPMLFRVPPSSLKELSTMADALKARGYPYNSVAVRIGFDMEVSHPKPTFQALRPLNDEEADVVVELYQSDGVERVLADNDVAVETPTAASPGSFIHEPIVARPSPAMTVAAGAAAVPANWEPPVATPVPQAPAMPPPGFAPPPPPQAQPMQFAPPPPTASPPQVATPGMVAITPFSQGAPPPVPPATAFTQPMLASPAVIQLAPEPPAAAPEPAAAKRPRRAPVQPVGAPEQAENEAAPQPAQMGVDIENILKGLSAFTGGK